MLSPACSFLNQLPIGDGRKRHHQNLADPWRAQFVTTSIVPVNTDERAHVTVHKTTERENINAEKGHPARVRKPF